jgi:hypothetical protein
MTLYHSLKKTVLLFDSAQRRPADFATVDLLEKKLNGTYEAIETIKDILLLLAGDVSFWQFVRITLADICRHD